MIKKQNIVTTVHQPADSGGCAHYRMKFPAWTAQAMSKGVAIIETHKSVIQPEFYKDVRVVRLQRQVTTPQLKFIEKFLKPLSLQYGFHIMYEIDDVIGAKDIPKYNIGRDAFQSSELMANIIKILHICDTVTVSTQELANYYIKNFGVTKKDKIYVIPNYLPKWWIDGIYDIDKIQNRFNNIKKPNIVYLSSTTHYDIRNKNNGIDDFTHIVDYVRSTVDEFNWTFIGGVPKQLEDLHKTNKIKYIGGFDVLNYPKEVNKLNFDIVVAPLMDNIFNRCKSNIKFIEMAAMGIPCICQNLPLYSKYTDLTFNNSNDLDDQIRNVLKKSNYMDIVKHNRNIIDLGDVNAPNGWWLENNINKWFNIFNIKQRPFEIDLRLIDSLKNKV